MELKTSLEKRSISVITENLYSEEIKQLLTLRNIKLRKSKYVGKKLKQMK